MNLDKLRIIPFGGLGEIGKNMLAFEYADEIVIIDCGIQFPDNDLHGVDLIIPDIEYLKSTKKNINILITHGHEDHIGALKFITQDIECVVYAPRFAKLLIEKDNRFSSKIIEIQEKVLVQVNEYFCATWFTVSHSIPDSMGIVLDTPVGKMVHTGDFKLDFDDEILHLTDRPFLEQLGKENVRILFSDSTYAEIEGTTPTENVLDNVFLSILEKAPGRIIFSTFSSLIRRIQKIITISESMGKQVCFIGSSMIKYTDIAFQYGYLASAANTVIHSKHISKTDPNNLVIVMTGSQGEPNSALTRLSRNALKEISIEPTDTVVLSSGPIPGNETRVSGVVNALSRKCTEVIYEPLRNVHVHGHASNLELRWMIETIKPKHLIPVHGENKHLVEHFKIGIESGMKQSQISILNDGETLEVSEENISNGPSLDLKQIWVKGTRVFDGCQSVQKERQSMANDGICIVNINLSDKFDVKCREFGIVSEKKKTTFCAEIENLIIQEKYKIISLLNTQGTQADAINEIIRNLIYKSYTYYPKIFCSVTFS